MLENQLKQLGFNKNEIKVYLSLFDLGQSKAGQIIEHTGLHRNLVYTALEELTAKNVISRMERGKIFVFELNDPEILKELIEEKLDTAKNVVDELRGRLHTKPRDVRIYEGTEGVITTREQVAREIKPGEDYYVMGVSYSTSNQELSDYFPKLNKKIIKKGGDIKVLVAGNEQPKIITERGLTWEKNARYLPFGVNSPMWMTLFRDTMNISIVGQDPITFSIRSQETADGFKKYFEYFWNQEVRVETGLQAVKKAYENMLEELAPGEEYCNLGASDGKSGLIIKNFYDNFHIGRIKKGVRVKILAYKESFEQIKQRYINAGDPGFKLSEIKMFINTPSSPVQTVFYHDKMFMCIMSENPTVIYFDQPEVAKNFKLYFEQVWDQKIIIETGIDILKKTIYEMLNELDKDEEYSVLGASAGDKDNNIQKLYDQFHTDRINKGVITKMLVYRESLERIKKRYHECGDPDGKVSFVKTYTTTPSTPMQINLFRNKAFIILYGEEPTIIKFEQKEIYDGFKKYFDELWNQETQILTGAEILKDLWLEGIECKEMRWIGARGYFVDRYPEIFQKIKTKAENTPGIVWKNIIDSDFRGHLLTKLPWMETRYNLSSTKNPIAIWLFGNKVLIVNWSEDIPVIFQSTNKQLVQSYSDYFEQLWEQNNLNLQGEKGIKELCEKVLETKQDLYLIGATGSIIKKHKEFYADFTQKRVNQNNYIHMLANSERIENEFTKLPMCHIKYLPKEFNSPMVIWIFGDYVANVLWQDPETITLTKDEKMAKSYLDYYKALEKITI